MTADQGCLGGAWAEGTPLNHKDVTPRIVQGRRQGYAMLFAMCTKYYVCLTWDIFRHCPPLASMVLSATSKDFEPMQSPEFMACCFCNKPTNAVSPGLDSSSVCSFQLLRQACESQQERNSRRAQGHTTEM